MSEPAFDTKKAMTRLRDEAGFEQRASEAMVGVLADVMDDVATKTFVRDEIAALEQRLDSRFDAQTAHMEKRFAEQSAEMDRRFAEVDRRFAEIDGRFAEVDRRFAEIDGHFAKIDGRFAKIDGRFAKIEARFAEIDKRFAEQSAEMDKRFAEQSAEIAGLRTDFHHALVVQTRWMVSMMVAMTGVFLAIVKLL